LKYTDRINNELEKGNLINEYALNCEPAPSSNYQSIGKRVLTVTMEKKFLHFQVMRAKLKLNP